MPIDPISTVLVAALYAPIALSANRAWRTTEFHGSQASELFETDRPVLAFETATTRLASSLFKQALPNRHVAVLNEILHYGKFQNGWDGPRSVGPSLNSVKAAESFVHALPAGLPLPTPMVSGTGEVGFYWNEEAGYADMSFDAEGVGSFFSKDQSGEEFFEDEVRVSELRRDWFFEKLGVIATPVRQAA